MIYTVIFHPEADKEYRESFLWYEKKVKGLGYRFEIVVEGKIREIMNNLEKYPKRMGLYREAPVGGFPYVIVYRINKMLERIFVSSLFHTSRNPKRKYRRDK
ncbi:MAG: type II toxin-antitoxin system RelE/ParE family toxin [Chitinophagaceae bacterium]|nr:type II toxin-antitoxin system RelE/ParE family toxin [Chitinophagaceae bacterium]